MNTLEKRGVGRPRLEGNEQPSESLERSEIREGRSESRDENTGREERIPVGRARLKLKVPEILGYVIRWVNDEPGRIFEFKRGGYEFVKPDEIDGKFGDTDIDNTNRDLGDKVSRTVDKGTGKRAYLMKIKKEYFDQDQRDKQKDIDEVDRMIHNGKLKQFVNQYVPEKGIQIRTSNERI